MKINRMGEAPEPKQEPKVQRAQPQRAAAPQPPRPAAPRPQPEPKPKRRPQPEPEEDYEEDDEEEDDRPRRGFPIGCLVVLLLLALIGFGGYKAFQCYSELSGKNELGKEQAIVVEQGSSVASIAATLKEEGVIEYDWLFKQYAKHSGKAGNLQYGTFYLRNGMSYNDILAALSIQQVFRSTISCTFPEGSTAVAIAQIMENAGLCTVEEFLNCANGWDGSDFSQYDFWANIPENGRVMKCEGYLFPDTYEFYTDDTVYNYVNTFYREFDRRTTDLAEQAAARGASLDDAVILASFIQEEAGMPAEDAKVSAVFHNRMETTNPLWSAHRLESNACSYIMQDYENNYLWNSPTAEYMGWVAAGEIPDYILEIYDTYQVSGLPAGPISNPGYDAIAAALNPDEDFMEQGYFFFVTGNPSGNHPGEYFYAKTADEHYQNCITAGWA